MSYHLSKMVGLGFDAAVDATIAALQAEGFGVLTDIDVAATMQKKLGVAFRPYRILGACNPRIAHEALGAEARLGVMLPCNVIVRETADKRVEVATVDPVTAMERTGNPALEPAAHKVRQLLSTVIERL